MKKVINSKFRILIALLAVLISACNTNATFSKRYHSRGFHIAWNSGSTNKIGTNNKAIAGLTLGLLLAVYALVVTIYVLAILSFFW